MEYSCRYYFLLIYNATAYCVKRTIPTVSLVSPGESEPKDFLLGIWNWQVPISLALVGKIWLVSAMSKQKYVQVLAFLPVLVSPGPLQGKICFGLRLEFATSFLVLKPFLFFTFSASDNLKNEKGMNGWSWRRIHLHSSKLSRTYWLGGALNVLRKR